MTKQKHIVSSLLFQTLFWGWTCTIMLLYTPLLLFPRERIIWIQKLWTAPVFFFLRKIAGIHVDIKGRENLPQEPCILAGRHESAFDTMIYVHVTRNPTMVLKKELTRIPVFGQLMKKFPMISVDRQGGSRTLKKLIKDTAACLAQKRNIIIFPEGIRVDPGKSVPLQPGIAFMAKELNVPVVPVATNSGTYWPRRRFVKTPGTITLQILPPMRHTGNTKEFLSQLNETLNTASAALCQKEGDLSPPLKKSPCWRAIVGGLLGIFFLARLGEGWLLYYAAQKFEKEMASYGVWNHQNKVISVDTTFKPTLTYSAPAFTSSETPSNRLSCAILSCSFSWVGLRANIAGEDLVINVPSLADQSLEGEEFSFSIQHLFSTTLLVPFLNLKFPHNDVDVLSLTNLSITSKPDNRWEIALEDLSRIPNMSVPVSLKDVSLSVDHDSAPTPNRATEADLTEATIITFGGLTLKAEGHLSYKTIDDVMASGTLTVMEEGDYAPVGDLFSALFTSAKPLKDYLPLNKALSLFLPRGAHVEKDPKTGRPQLRFSYQEGTLLIDGHEVTWHWKK
ncbi:1-acyl-sn-glycerol-3-phosphate acyltransferase [Alphaproteobacteria bacterium]|nr:1-acyl-sn-glycerol-3-phosphate acyltransferase [Alphaproteobacteria bacterium]